MDTCRQLFIFHLTTRWYCLCPVCNLYSTAASASLTCRKFHSASEWSTFTLRARQEACIPGNDYAFLQAKFCMHDVSTEWYNTIWMCCVDGSVTRQRAFLLHAGCNSIWTRVKLETNLQSKQKSCFAANMYIWPGNSHDYLYLCYIKYSALVTLFYCLVLIIYACGQRSLCWLNTRCCSARRPQPSCKPMIKCRQRQL
jgi:hypothetical protein